MLPVRSLLDSFGHGVTAAAVITGRGFFQITVWEVRAGLCVGLQTGIEAGEAWVWVLARDPAIPVLMWGILRRWKDQIMMRYYKAQCCVQTPSWHFCDRVTMTIITGLYLIGSRSGGQLSEWLCQCCLKATNGAENLISQEEFERSLLFYWLNPLGHCTLYMCTHPLHWGSVLLGRHRGYWPHWRRDLGDLEVITILRVTSIVPGPAVSPWGREATRDLRLRLLGLGLRVWRFVSHPRDIYRRLAELEMCSLDIIIYFLKISEDWCQHDIMNGSRVNRRLIVFPWHYSRLSDDLLTQ